MKRNVWRRTGFVSMLTVGLAIPSQATDPVLGDVRMDRLSTTNAIPPVVFPHWKHRTEFRCYACHPEIFEMRAGANAVSMDAISRGEFCGACHDGHTAFAVGFDSCRTCHSGAEQ